MFTDYKERKAETLPQEGGLAWGHQPLQQLQIQPAEERLCRAKGRREAKQEGLHSSGHGFFTALGKYTLRGCQFCQGT